MWAVGYYYNGGIYQTLVEHWNGTSWSVVSSPNPGTDDNYLSGVAAVSANDVWAVGYYDNGSGASQTLVEHWNGTAWSVVPSPNAGTSYNYLNGVAAVSASDVWAVGYYGIGGSTNQTLVEHWDGTAWSVVSSPNVGTNQLPQWSSGGIGQRCVGRGGLLQRQHNTRRWWSTGTAAPGR